MKIIVTVLIGLSLTMTSCSKIYMVSDLVKSHRMIIKNHPELKAIDVYWCDGACDKKFEVIAIYAPPHFDIPLFATRSMFFKNGISKKAVEKAKQLNGDAVIIKDYVLVSIIKYIK